MDFAILAALGGCFGYAVVQTGGIGWRDWSLTLVGVGSLGCLYFLWNLRRRTERTATLDPGASFSAAAFLCFVALQLIPLPLSIVRHISPKRAELQEVVFPLGRVSLPQGSTEFVTLSAVPHATAEYLLTTSSYVLIFLLVRDLSLRLSKWPWAPVVPLLIVVGLEAVLGLSQVSVGGATNFATGTYASRDHYAGLIEMILPFPAMFAVAVLRRNPSRFESRAAPALKAGFLLAIAGIMLVAIVLSLSRMGFLAAMASLLLAGVAAAASLRTGIVTDDVPRRSWRKWVPTTAIIVIVAFGFFFLPTNSLVARFAELNKTGEISPDTRLQIWRDAIHLVRDYPLFGCGMGGFESCFLKYKMVAPMNTVDYAHNDYLQVLAELGLFGFLAGLLFVFRLFQRILQAAFNCRTIDGRCLAIACMASMTAILLHSFVDFNMYVPTNGMLFAWIAGIAGVYLVPRRPQPNPVP